jgi:hypothetical protein
MSWARCTGGGVGLNRTHAARLLAPRPANPPAIGTVPCPPTTIAAAGAADSVPADGSSSCAVFLPGCATGEGEGCAAERANERTGGRDWCDSPAATAAHLTHTRKLCHAHAPLLRVLLSLCVSACACARACSSVNWWDLFLDTRQFKAPFSVPEVLPPTANSNG